MAEKCEAFARVRLVDPMKARSRRVRRILGRAVRSNIESQGAGLAGFALVTWDGRGGVHTSFHSADGPIGMTMLPAYVSDALNRHVTLELAQESALQPLPEIP